MHCDKEQDDTVKVLADAFHLKPLDGGYRREGTAIEHAYTLENDGACSGGASDSSGGDAQTCGAADATRCKSAPPSKSATLSGMFRSVGVDPDRLVQLGV